MTEFESFAEAVRKLGVVSYHTALRRHRKKGWSKQLALATPRFQNPDKLFLPGQRFSMLVVIRREPSEKDRNSRWLCLCDCGNTTVVLRKNLVPAPGKEHGRTRSCGCLRKIAAQKRSEGGANVSDS
jgi:hypothetical protein